LRFHPPVLWSTTKSTFFGGRHNQPIQVPTEKYELQAAECKNLQNKEYTKKLSKMSIVRMINLHIGREVCMQKQELNSDECSKQHKKVKIEQKKVKQTEFRWMCR